MRPREASDRSRIVVDGLRARVDALESTIRAQLASMTRPATPKRRAMPPAPVEPVLAPPPAPLSPAVVDERDPSAEPAAPPTEAAALLPLLPDEPAPTPALPRPRRASSSKPADLSNLLQHHREMQDSLGDDLATMARQLKLNTLHFQSSLAADRLVMDEAEQRVGSNLVGMQGQSGRLGAYRKKGGTTTCFVILAVMGVSVAWFFMFALSASAIPPGVGDDADERLSARGLKAACTHDAS